MSENQFKYGTGMSSVKIHQRPGGNSSFSLGWGMEEEKKPEAVRVVPVPVEPAQVAPPAEEEKKEEEKKEEEKKEEPSKAAGKARVPPGGASSFSFY